MLTIGAFSNISKVSANTLRYYDEIGLLKPAVVNRENGYRYYETAQLQTVLMITRLKAYQLSLEEIAEILRHPDQSELLEVMRRKRHDLGQKLYQLSSTLDRMNQDITSLERGVHIMAYMDRIEVRLKETEPQNVLFIRRMMSTKDYGICLAELYRTIQQEKLTVTGAPMTVYHVEESFDPDCYDNEIAIPVKEVIEGTRVMPGGPCVTARLEGPYTELASVYAKLQQWIEKEGYARGYEAYESYLTDPNTTKADKNITEVCIPVKKIKTGGAG